MTLLEFMDKHNLKSKDIRILLNKTTETIKVWKSQELSKRSVEDIQKLAKHCSIEINNLIN